MQSIRPNTATIAALIGLGLLIAGGSILHNALPGLAAQFAAPGTSTWPFATQFLLQGMGHILLGWDHLAFLLCLALVARGRQLAWLASIFALGHAISLGLGFFAVVRLPATLVEIAIALSIVFLAWEALTAARGGKRMSFRSQIGTVFLFGLLHGLGFAHALADLAVPHGGEWAGLAFFSIGIELGQLLFVGATMATLAALRRIALAEPARLAALCAVGLMGCFWTVERAAFLAA